MLYPCYAHLKKHRKTTKKNDYFYCILGCLWKARPSTSQKIPAKSAFEVMKGTSSLKINPFPIPFIVKNKSYKGYLQELKIGEVSNSLRQLALKLQSYELPARLRWLVCFKVNSTFTQILYNKCTKQIDLAA
jgi:hypothetical protein